ncbi:hypothetical protein JCM16358_26510 [Halanaerocella petrolearia]
MFKITEVIALTLLFVLVFPIVTTPFAPNFTQVTAAEVSKDTAYKGLALTGILILTVNWLTDDAESKNREGQIISEDDYNQDKIYWLAKAVNGEARGEPYRGQVAVAAVILNRVVSSEFPNTIYSVIHQKKQFSSVQDGQINLKPTVSAYKAAKEALNGKDPSQGALYFYNPKTAKYISWFQTKETTVKIGDHVFAK